MLKKIEFSTNKRKLIRNTGTRYGIYMYIVWFQVDGFEERGSYYHPIQYHAPYAMIETLVNRLTLFSVRSIPCTGTIPKS
jgi:hypothetical protein